MSLYEAFLAGRNCQRCLKFRDMPLTSLADQREKEAGLGGGGATTIVFSPAGKRYFQKLEKGKPYIMAYLHPGPD